MVVGQRGQRGRRRRKFSIFKVGSYLPLYSTQPCFEGNYSTCVSTNALKICMVLINTLMEVSPKFQKISSTIPCVIRNVNFVLLIASKVNGQFVRNFTDTFDNEFRSTVHMCNLIEHRQSKAHQRKPGFCQAVMLLSLPTGSTYLQSLFTQL